MRIGNSGLELSVTAGGDPEGAVVLKQVHGSRIVTDPCGGEEADGMILTRGSALPCIRVADCLPVFAVWEHHLGACHAGWRGLAAGIVEEMLSIVDEPLQYLVLGPSICPGCYQVGEEVRVAVAEGDPEGLSAFAPGSVDLRGSALRRARRLRGSDFITVSDSRCTLETCELFSYRRDRTVGRNLVRLAETNRPEHIHRPFQQTMSIPREEIK